MVMEPLGLSLYDLLKKRDHRGLPIGLVRSVARYDRRPGERAIVEKLTNVLCSLYTDT